MIAMTIFIAVIAFMGGFVWGVITVALLAANERKEKKGEAERWED